MGTDSKAPPLDGLVEAGGGTLPGGSDSDTLVQLSAVLAETPPGDRAHRVKDLAVPGAAMEWWLFVPQLALHCSACKGERFADGRLLGVPEIGKKPTHKVLRYDCRNCGTFLKLYSLLTQGTDPPPALMVGCPSHVGGSVIKYGEYPVYGPPVPARVTTWAGPDRDLFIKGRRCENQGLGIGAFSYYRRVVEDQKNRLLDEIIKVAAVSDPVPQELVSQLEDAKTEKQFSKALDKVKAALPESLMIKGHNPLRALHSALSHNLHNESDEACLAAAGAIRLVLAEFADRLAATLEEKRELMSALKLLANPKT